MYIKTQPRDIRAIESETIQYRSFLCVEEGILPRKLGLIVDTATLKKSTPWKRRSENEPRT